MKCKTPGCQKEAISYYLKGSDKLCWKCNDDQIIYDTWLKTARKAFQKHKHTMNKLKENDMSRQTTLPTDSAERKTYPLLRGCLKYFSAALAGVARTSYLGNQKHNPGEDMHHARGKSSDHGDCILRHLMDTEDLLAAQKRGENVTDQQILDEANQMAWRALAYCQELHELKGAPMASGAKK